LNVKLQRKELPRKTEISGPRIVVIYFFIKKKTVILSPQPFDSMKPKASIGFLRRNQRQFFDRSS
jgi:hypothetical protein